MAHTLKETIDLGYNVMVGWETATSFTIGTTTESPAVGETNWFAIGYWK